MDKNRPLSVVQIASGDLWAGAEVQLFTLASALSEMPQVNVHVILLNHGKLEQKLRDTGIDVAVFDESKINGLSILFSMTKAIHTIKPDIIHTHRLKENIIGTVAAILNGNIRSLRTAHGAPEHKPLWSQLAKRMIYSLDWFLARHVQKIVVAVSQDLANILKQELPAKKIQVIENGIDIHQLEHFVDTNEKAETSTIKLGIVGRLVPVKRVDLFIKTAGQIKQHYPQLNTEFHIYGDGPLYEELQRLNHDSRTDDIVHFEGHSESIHKDIRSLDALLMTSDHEGLPMTLLEAMALRTPIIAHAVGGIPNLLDYGKSGRLVEMHTVQGYSDAIKQLFSSDEIVTDLTERAYQRVVENYSADSNANNYLNLYRSLIK